MRLDIDQEFYIRPFHQGVKLITPEAKQHAKMRITPSDIPEIKIKDLLTLPVNVYFLNTDSEFQISNEQNVYTCGYDSLKDALGKTVQAVAKDGTAERLIYNDKKTMQENFLQIIEEDHIRKKDSCEHRGVSFKVPIYSNDNKISGVFGMTALNGIEAKIKFDEALSCILATRLFSFGKNTVSWQENFQKCKHLPGRKFNGIYFSSQEIRCLEQLIRGKSMKSIAKYLELSPRTVESYLRNMRFKAKVDYTSDLIEMVIDSINGSISNH